MEQFKKFLKENVKAECYSVEAYRVDLLTQYGETGREEYELSKYESKSGNSELFSYNIEDFI